jgi:hypothetical protein
MDVSEELIRQAFALSHARGADLLLLLGNFDVWHGDLAEMRGDSPRAEQAASAHPVITNRSHLADVLLMSRAIEALDADCRTALMTLYGARDGSPDAAPDRETNHDSSNHQRVSTCRSRLVAAYAELQKQTTGPATPEWVAEREHAAVSASHGHRRG